MMAVSEDYMDFLKTQLSGFGEVHMKKMFGGIGIFHEGKMFGMIARDVFRLKVDEYNKADYDAREMGPFMHTPGKKPMPYYEVPVDVLEDIDKLTTWANKAYEAALRASKK